MNAGRGAAAAAWLSFGRTESEAVEQLWTVFQADGSDECSTVRMSRGHYEYEIDFRAMRQTNLRTGRVRELRRRALEDRQAATSELAELSAENQALSAENQSLKEEVERLKSSLKRQQETAERAVGAEKRQRVEREAELEAWRRLPLEPQICELRTRDSHVGAAVQELLRAMILEGHGSTQPCCAASGLVVETVQQVQNLTQWRRYSSRKQEILEALKSRRNCPWASDLAPRVKELRQRLGHIVLDDYANEVLLFHGTAAKNAEAIATQGFDDRLSGRDLYGVGVYFTTDTCKVLQYCGDRDREGRSCLFIARVLLGHPYQAKCALKGQKRPPLVENHMPYDSVIAAPGTLNGRPERQVHWEFVVQGAQAYPEFLVRFKT